MTTVTEGTHKLADGHELYTKTWKAANEKARMLFLHGFSDHSNNYETFFPYLAERGITVYCFDQRGWGRSVHEPREKGLSGGTSKVLADITSVLRPILDDKSSKTPVFLAGQSMGGGESLTYAVLDPDGLVSRLRGSIGVAPLIALHPTTRPFAATVTLGRLVGKVLPNHQLVSKLKPHLLSHNPAKNQAWVNDPLCHDTGTLEQIDGMLGRAASLDSGEYVLAEGKHEGGVSRVIVAHGDCDEINDYSASKRWVERLDVKDKTLYTLPGQYHVLHEEPDTHEEFRKEIADWILARSGPLKA